MTDTIHTRTDEYRVDDDDLREASPSAGWRTTYAALGAAPIDAADREVGR